MSAKTAEKLLRRRRHVGRVRAPGAPNRGLGSCLCHWVEGPGLSGSRGGKCRWYDYNEGIYVRSMSVMLL